jgi:hypothetical protein
VPDHNVYESGELLMAPSRTEFRTQQYGRQRDQRAPSLVANGVESIPEGIKLDEPRSYLNVICILILYTAK